MTEFVKAASEDAGTIAALRQRIWDSTYRGIYPGAMIDSFDFSWHRERDLRRIQSDACLVYLIQRAGEAVGYLTLKKGEPPQLMSLYLLPSAQGQGIGTQAFEIIRDLCRQWGSPHFTCQCQPENIGARAFYRKMGGTITGEDLENQEKWQNSVTFTFETER